MAWHGLLTAELGAAVASALGLVVKLGMLPETRHRSLEALSEPEVRAPARDLPRQEDAVTDQSYKEMCGYSCARCHAMWHMKICSLGRTYAAPPVI